MFAVENQLPSDARVITWCGHCPSKRSDDVGLKARARKRLSARPSEASAKIGPDTRPRLRSIFRVRLGVLSAAIPPQRLYRPCGTANGTGGPAASTWGRA